MAVSATGESPTCTTVSHRTAPHPRAVRSACVHGGQGPPPPIFDTATRYRRMLEGTTGQRPRPSGLETLAHFFFLPSRRHPFALVDVPRATVALALSVLVAIVVSLQATDLVSGSCVVVRMPSSYVHELEPESPSSSRHRLCVQPSGLRCAIRRSANPPTSLLLIRSSTRDTLSSRGELPHKTPLPAARSVAPSMP